MSDWSGPLPAYGLSSNEGELVSLRIEVEPRLLERLLEALAGLPFPVNPQLRHSPPAVEFPAYESRLPEVRSALQAASLSGLRVTKHRMILELRGRGGWDLDFDHETVLT